MSVRQSSSILSGVVGFLTVHDVRGSLQSRAFGELCATERTRGHFNVFIVIAVFSVFDSHCCGKSLVGWSSHGRCAGSLPTVSPQNGHSKDWVCVLVFILYSYIRLSVVVTRRHQPPLFRVHPEQLIQDNLRVWPLLQASLHQQGLTPV